jgi:hypothetical protein
VSGTYTSGAGFKVNQFSIQPFSSTNIILGFNSFFNGTNNVYDTTGSASYLQLIGDTYTFITASSGTAGATLSGTTTILSMSPFAFNISGSLSILGGRHTFTTNNAVLRIGSATGSTSSNIKLDYFQTGGYSHWIVPVMSGAGSSDDNNIGIYLNSSNSVGGSSAPGTGNALSIRFGGITNTSYKPLLIEETTTLNTYPVASSILNLNSTTKGFLPPRGTNTQMLAIASPATGLIFFDTTNNKLNCYDGTTWQPCW